MLERTVILQALEALSQHLAARGVRGEICLFGGAAMVLAFQTRQSTKDVDAVFAPAAAVREAAAEIGRELRLPEGWLNDGVKGWLSEAHATTRAELPQFPNLAVTMPLPEYLLAMKCMAARAEAGSRDLEDTIFLLKHLGFAAAEPVLDLLERYYPVQLIPPRSRYFIEAALHELARSHA